VFASLPETQRLPALTSLLVWIIRRLMSPMIRQEFA
jgi:hypothetical protein